jgi:hypothetical protein
MATRTSWYLSNVRTKGSDCQTQKCMTSRPSTPQPERELAMPAARRPYSPIRRYDTTAQARTAELKGTTRAAKHRLRGQPPRGPWPKPAAT